MATSYYKDYDEYMERMLGYVPEGIDKREGSIVYTCLAAAAAPMSMMSMELEDLYANAFADTAVGEGLEKVAAILGLERMSATKAVVKVDSDAHLNIGTMLTGDGYEYKITDICDGYYLAECQTAGSEPNSRIGELVPKEDVEGLGSVSITAVIAKGKDEEDDESLRERFFERARYPICAGNMNYYREALREISGVGSAKILPVTESRGVIRVIITDMDCGVPSEELVNYVQEMIDPVETSGQGYGIAPIGHKVKVEGAEAVDIDLKVRLTLKALSLGSIKLMIGYYLIKRVEEENKKWARTEKTIIRDSFFENVFLDNYDGVEDVEILSINGEENRLVLQENQIIGKVNVTYV